MLFPTKEHSYVSTAQTAGIQRVVHTEWSSQGLFLPIKDLTGAVKPYSDFFKKIKHYNKDAIKCVCLYLESNRSEIYNSPSAWRRLREFINIDWSRFSANFSLTRSVLMPKQ